jgi:N-dimethylarginine dimethylaminohydrolase
MDLVCYTNEFEALKSAALYRPRVDEISQDEPAESMYESVPEAHKVLREVDAVINKLRELGVYVEVLEATVGENYPITTNMIYLRDSAFIFRDKIIAANMKFPLRSEEPSKLASLLIKNNQSYSDHIVSDSVNYSFEGADFLVFENNVSVYAGYRTDIGSISEIRKLFEAADFNEIQASISRVPQHILGGVHIVDSDLGLRRNKYCKDNIPGIRFIDFEETDEITKGFALNIITLGPKEILMPANRPATQSKLEKAGILCHTVQIDEIHKMGGGLACMMLPLVRGKV